MTTWKKFNRNRQRKARRFHGSFTQGGFVSDRYR
jgi:hypothetical protein